MSSCTAIPQGGNGMELFGLSTLPKNDTWCCDCRHHVSLGEESIFLEHVRHHALVLHAIKVSVQDCTAISHTGTNYKTFRSK